MTPPTSVLLIQLKFYLIQITVPTTLTVLTGHQTQSPEWEGWHQLTTGRNVTIQIYLMKVLNNVITLKWSNVTRNRNLKLLVSFFLHFLCIDEKKISWNFQLLFLYDPASNLKYLKWNICKVMNLLYQNFHEGVEKLKE